MVHAVTTLKSYHSGTHKFIRSDFNAVVTVPLTIVTTQSHAYLLSISPDVLKVNNAAQDINLDAWLHIFTGLDYWTGTLDRHIFGFYTCCGWFN